jgi:CDP-4-dehydro-6-deoxyglucose reductase/ferredoxin-NAD(P)+ reductase (naphthalene dioxygenase ferredoxin-specific)
MPRHAQLLRACRTIEVPDGRTLLDAALSEGIAYPHGCRSGRCGSCKSRLVSGEVELLPHTIFALSPGEREQGFVLACRSQLLSDVVVSWLGKEEERADHPVRSYTCQVVAVEDATHDIKRVLLAMPNGHPLDFTAGQYAQVTFPGAPTRDYSMANVPGGSELEFHVRRVPGGATSERVYASLRIGDAVEVRGPLGSSYLRERHTGPILAIAGGSGLAPMKAITETALAHGMRQPIRLYFGVRNERDLYLADHFGLLAEAFANLTFIPVLSEERDSTRFRIGFVTDAIASDVEDFDGWKTYMAGPPAMIDAAGPLLLERGLRMEDLHADVFFTPEEVTAKAVEERSAR